MFTTLSYYFWHYGFLGQIARIGDKPLRRVLARYGGWPVADKNWDPESFDLELVLGRMRKRFSNVPSIIDVWVAPDDKNSTVNIIQVSKIYKICGHTFLLTKIIIFKNNNKKACFNVMN